MARYQAKDKKSQKRILKPTEFSYSCIYCTLDYKKGLITYLKILLARREIRQSTELQWTGREELVWESDRSSEYPFLHESRFGPKV